MNKFEMPNLVENDGEKLKKFEVTFKDGRTSTLEGTDISDAIYRDGGHSGVLEEIEWKEIKDNDLEEVNKE